MCNIWFYTHKEKQYNILTAVVDLQGGADLLLLGYLNKSHWLSPCTLRDLSYGGYLADQRRLIPCVKRAFVITLERQSETGHPCHLACVSPPSFTSVCSTRWCIIFNQNHLQFPQISHSSCLEFMIILAWVKPYKLRSQSKETTLKSDHKLN